MNEHIEYFKRWSNCYLMWSHSNMDRIARETVAKHKKEMMKERKQNSPYMKQMRELFSASNEYFNKIANELIKDVFYYDGSYWQKTGVIGSTLKIKLPSDS